jgi:type I restriction enzyme, S subunit
MSGGLHELPLGDLVEIRKGVSYKGEFLDQPGPALLGLGVVRPGGGFKEGKARTYAGPFKAHHAVLPGDLFIALTDLTQEGTVLGSPVMVPATLGPAVITHHVASLRLKPGVAMDPRYLYYALCSDASRGHFRGIATGTTVRAVSPADAARVAIPVLPPREMARIGAILGALDDKIELNEQMNRLLEEVAQTVFEAWFIDFHGCAPAGMKDSDMGRIPKGWTAGGLDDMVRFEPKVPIKKGQEATYVDMKAVPTIGPSVSAWITRAYAGGARFQNGDTLLARITPCLENGKSALVDFLAEGEAAFGSTEFTVLRPKPGVPRAWPYCLVRHPPFRAHAIANMTGSSGRQRVPAVALACYRLAIPPQDLLEKFGALAEPLFQRITSSTREANTLRELREVLLGRLFNGDLDPLALEAEAGIVLQEHASRVN